MFAKQMFRVGCGAIAALGLDQQIISSQDRVKFIAPDAQLPQRLLKQIIELPHTQSWQLPANPKHQRYNMACPVLLLAGVPK